MRVVFAANLLVSVAISEGPSYRIVQARLQGQAFEVVICDLALDGIVPN